MKSILTLILALVALTSATLGQTFPERNPVAAVGTVANASLTEISGIAASRKNDGVIWAHNDSGDQNRLFAMATNGTHLGIFYLQGASATDWEDMAIGPGPDSTLDYLFVADTGNNDFNRSTVTIYRVPEPVLDGVQFPVQTTLNGVDEFPVRYPGQTRDVETLLVDPLSGDIFLLTRDRQLTGTTEVYVYPIGEQTPGVLATLTYVGAITSSIQIKGGDVSPDGKWILLRRHSNTAPVDGWIYYRASARLEDAFRTVPSLVPLVFEPQGEAITFTPDSTGYYTISEGAAQPIYFYGPLTAPAAPGNGNARALSSTRVELSWTDNANNESGYVIHRSADGGVTFTQLPPLPANTTSYTDSSLTPSTTYSYWIAAINNAGSSAYLGPIQVTTPAPPPPAPSAPINLSATAVSKSQINLSWTDTASNEDSFTIERSANGSTFTQIATVTTPNTTTFVNSGLSAGKLYYYRVRAYNAGGYSAYSNVASARTPKR